MNSRALHEELGVKSKHADWIARKIASLDLEEGEDYTVEEAEGRKYYALSPEAVAWIRASTSKEQLKEMASTNVKTKAILKDLEYVELQVPEGFETFKGEVVVSSAHLASILKVSHKTVLRSIRRELDLLQSAPSGADYIQRAVRSVLEGVSESCYIDARGRVQPILYINEHACMSIMARYSAEFRALLSYKFIEYRDALIKYLQAETVAKHIPQKPLSRRYVYIISNPVTGSFKIGIAKDIEKRLQALQTGNEVELTLFYASLACSNASLIETDVHKHFAEYRLVGEWFSSKLDKLEVIDYLKEQNYVLESNFGEEYEIL